MQSIDMLTGNA